MFGLLDLALALAATFDESSELGMVDQVRHQLRGLTTWEGLTIVVEGAKDPLDRDGFQGCLETLGHLLADGEEDEGEEQRRIELELYAGGRGLPEGGQSVHAFGAQDGSFNPPAASLQLTALPR